MHRRWWIQHLACEHKHWCTCAQTQFIESAMRELCEFLLRNETERTAISSLLFLCFNLNSIYTGTINFTIYSRHRSLTASPSLFLSITSFCCALRYFALTHRCNILKNVVEWQWKSMKCITLSQLRWAGPGFQRERKTINFIWFGNSFVFLLLSLLSLSK